MKTLRSQPECIFCDLFVRPEYLKPLFSDLNQISKQQMNIREKTLATPVIYRDSKMIVLKDIRPKDDYHYLICPIEHVHDFVTSDESVLHYALNLHKIIVKKLNLSTVRTVFNYNSPRIPIDFREPSGSRNVTYQDVGHAHLHLIGNHKYDELTTLS